MAKTSLLVRSLLFGCCALGGVAAQQTLTVGPSGSYATIQAAIVAASAGDTVLVAPGTYVEQIDFLGKDVAVLASGAFGRDSHVIDGGGVGPVVRFEGGESLAARLEGFTITGGVGVSPTYSWQFPANAGHGGVQVYGSSPSLSDCWIVGNVGGSLDPQSAGGDGGVGGMIVVNGTPRLSSCHFEANVGGNGKAAAPFGNQEGHGGVGGLRWVGGGDAVLDGCVFVGNRGGDGDTDAGVGAVRISGRGSTVLSACSFVGNLGGRWSTGGLWTAVMPSPHFIGIDGCSFLGNVAGPSGSAGACWLAGGGDTPITISGSHFEDNEGRVSGAAVLASLQQQDFVDCSFVRNRGRGGFASAICTNGGITGVARTRIEGHGQGAFTLGGADLGTGMVYGRAIISLVDCRVVGNADPDVGGVLATVNLTRTVLAHSGALHRWASIRDSIYWGNASAPTWCRPGWMGVGSICDVVQYSCVEGGVPTSVPASYGNISQDPQFVRQPSPGVDGVWGTVDDDYGDLRLQPTSPCIDAAAPTSSPLGQDIVGMPRLLDGDLDGAMRVDMGAHEFGNVAAALSIPAPNQLDVSLSGTAGLPATLLVGFPSATGLPIAPLGELYLDVAMPALILPVGPLPQSPSFTYPSGSYDLALQAVVLGGAGGNLSNAETLSVR